MNLTKELILGFGRTLKSSRERLGLSQKEFAEGMGIGIAQVKRYEQENLDLIGPNGFTLQMFTKLALFLGVHPVALLQDIVSKADLPKLSDSQSKVNELAANMTSDCVDRLLEARRDSGFPFQNELSWSLDMASRLSGLSGDSKAEIGQKILHEQIKAGLVAKSEVTKQLQDLFRYSLS